MSSSGLQSAMESLLLNNYPCLFPICVVVYDYLLTFSREVDYVWCRPWTWISTVFLVVRYLGLAWAVLGNLYGSTFIPGPHSVSMIMFLATSWGYIIFLSAADLVMIMRVYAMWNRTKTVLYALSVIYATQVILSLVFSSIYYNPNTHRVLVATSQLVDFSYCTNSFPNPPSLLILFTELPRFILGFALLVLAVTQTLQHSVEMYKATTTWQPNRYMQLLVRDGLLYFLVMALINVTTLVAISVPSTGTSPPIVLLSALGDAAICIAMPRFIMSIRELYDRDRHGRWQRIDNGFGVSSQPICSQISAMEFAGVSTTGQSEAMEHADELEGIELEDREGKMGQASASA